MTVQGDKTPKASTAKSVLASFRWKASQRLASPVSWASLTEKARLSSQPAGALLPLPPSRVKDGQALGERRSRLGDAL
jgi:hypothetical protein